MLSAKRFVVSTAFGAVGAGVLLGIQSNSPTATLSKPTSRDVQLAAQPFGLIYPWAVGQGTPTSSTGVGAVSAVVDAAGAAAAATLQTANQLGPLTFGLDSIRAISGKLPPPGSTHSSVNVTSMDQWAAGIAGLANSTGLVGFTQNFGAYDPFLGTHAGVLQTANQVGPFVFNLNVPKAIGFVQAPTGVVLPSGQPDILSAVDIGRWTVGIPGVITNSGTTGFSANQDFGNGPIIERWVGGLRTTTQIGSQSFDFNFLPAITVGVIPPGISFSFAPDLTADDSAFAGMSPPPPGVVQPLPSPPAPLAASTPAVADTPLADPDEDAAQIRAARNVDTEPKTEIPGVNGAPLANTPNTGTTGVGGSNPFNPLKPFTDMITDGISAVTGNKQTTDGPGADTDAGGDTGSENDDG
jgi:hypothetical protein